MFIYSAKTRSKPLYNIIVSDSDLLQSRTNLNSKEAYES